MKEVLSLKKRKFERVKISCPNNDTKRNDEINHLHNYITNNAGGKKHEFLKK